jgi:hypothetical protein
VRTSIKACVLGIVIAACAAASASKLGPQIIINDPIGCVSSVGCVNLTSNTFSFQVPSAGFGNLHFLNVSGATFTSLILTETGVAAANIDCQADVFSCSVVAFGSNGAKLVLTSGPGLPGIPNGNSFEILLSCVNRNCWPAGLQFSAVANAPEPGTMALLLTGIGALVSRRKWRARISA